jgi:hypothetical protein
MSAAPRPEFFFDRSLGKDSAKELRQHGWVIHLVADHYPYDAQFIADAVWVAEGCSRGWVLLTQDQAIRHRANELVALDRHLFCLSNGNLKIEEKSRRFLAAESRMLRAVGKQVRGFWHVHDKGAISLMWPRKPELRFNRQE